MNSDVNSEMQIARCSRNHNEMKPISPSFALSYPVFHSIQYKLLDILEESTEIPWDTRLKSIWILISVQQLEESSMHPISSQVESWFPVFDWRFEPTFHHQLKCSFPSAIGMWGGSCVFCLKCNGPRETVTQKNPRFPCSDLNSGSCFISQNEGMSESPEESLDKAVVLLHIWVGGTTSLWYLKRYTEFKAWKGDDAWLFLKMDRNPNITVRSRKWAVVSCLTFRRVHIVLPSVF